MLDIFPPAMAKLRTEWRSFAPDEISVPQLRVLGNVFIGHNLIGDIAKHLGVSQPATSMLADALIKKGLLKKDKTANDRRRSPLALTARGRDVYLKTRKATEVKLSKIIATLSEEEQRALAAGLVQIEKVFLELL